MKLQLRRARSDDLSAIDILIKQLGYRISLEALKGKLSRYINDEHYAIFVATKEENTAHILGFVAIVIYDMIINDFNRCWVEAIIVDEIYRGQGIGKALMNEAEIYAANHNCLNINLITNISRKEQGSHDFYHKLGYHNKSPLGEKIFLRKDLIKFN